MDDDGPGAPPRGAATGRRADARRPPRAAPARTRRRASRRREHASRRPRPRRGRPPRAGTAGTNTDGSQPSGRALAPAVPAVVPPARLRARARSEAAGPREADTDERLRALEEKLDRVLKALDATRPAAPGGAAGATRRGPAACRPQGRRRARASRRNASTSASDHWIGMWPRPISSAVRASMIALQDSSSAAALAHFTAAAVRSGDRGATRHVQTSSCPTAVNRRSSKSSSTASSRPGPPSSSLASFASSRSEKSLREPGHLLIVVCLSAEEHPLGIPLKRTSSRTPVRLRQPG